MRTSLRRLAALAKRLLVEDGTTPAQKALRWLMFALVTLFLFVAFFVRWFLLASYAALAIALAAGALATAFTLGRIVRRFWIGSAIRRHGRREEGTVIGFDLLWINAPGYLGCTLRVALDSGSLAIANTQRSDLDHVSRGDRVTVLLHDGYPGDSRLIDYP